MSELPIKTKINDCALLNNPNSDTSNKDMKVKNWLRSDYDRYAIVNSKDEIITKYRVKGSAIRRIEEMAHDYFGEKFHIVDLSF